MKFQPTITKQGILLITIPLVFEIVFVLSLSALLRQGDEQRKEFAQSTEFVAGVSQLTQKVMEAVLTLSVWKTTRSEEYAKKFDSIVATLPEVNANLASLSHGDTVREKHAAALKESEERIFKLISGFRHPAAVAMMILMDPMIYRRDLSQALAAFINETTSIAEEQKAKQQQNARRDEKFHQLVGMTLMFGIGLNIIISLLMVHIFSRRITSRLAIVSDNCRRFVARTTLHKPVGGYDEIADLDLHIHDMEKTVRAAEQRRDEYVQMVNHDLRSPLTAIQTILAGTMKGLYGELTEKGKTRIEDAKLDANRLLELINEAMEVDRIDSGQFQLNRAPLDLTNLISDVTTSLNPLMEQKHMSFVMEPLDVEVNADRARLFRVLANIIDNAIKYSPDSSTIRVVLKQSKNEVMVEVADQGPGISASETEKMFKAYERGEHGSAKNPGGKGLGLAVCKKIVEAHGGRIGAQKGLRKGAIIWFTIPNASS
jgi:signal transduction histidine kinase